MDIYFEVIDPYGVKIRTTDTYWKKIIKLKHPSMQNEEDKVKLTIAKPEEIRQSNKNKSILIYYKGFKTFYICVVVKTTNGEGFIVTTYKTSKIKEGKIIWQR